MEEENIEKQKERDEEEKEEMQKKKEKQEKEETKDKEENGEEKNREEEEEKTEKRDEAHRKEKKEKKEKREKREKKEKKDKREELDKKEMDETVEKKEKREKRDKKEKKEKIEKKDDVAEEEEKGEKDEKEVKRKQKKKERKKEKRDDQEDDKRRARKERHKRHKERDRLEREEMELMMDMGAVVLTEHMEDIEEMQKRNKKDRDGREGVEMEEEEKMEQVGKMETDEQIQKVEKKKKLLYKQKHRKKIPTETYLNAKIIPPRLLRTLRLYAAACFDVNRHVCLAMKEFPVKEMRPKMANPRKIKKHEAPEFMMLFCIKFIENNVVYPLASVEFDKTSPYHQHHLANSMIAIIEDLHLISLHIIMSISLPELIYKNILRCIAKNPELCNEAEPIVYTVDGNEIVHVYDLYGLQVNFQNVFQTHKELNYLVYRNRDLFVLKCHWEDIELAMAAVGGDCSFGLDKRAQRTCVFIMSYYYAFLKAYESGVVGVGERDSYDATRYLLRMFCPAAQMFLSFTSVTPEQLEDLYDQFEDFRLALASAFFKMQEEEPRKEDAMPDIQKLQTMVKFTNITLDTFAEYYHDAQRMFLRRMSYNHTRIPSSDAGDRMRRKMDRWSFIYMEKVSQEFERLFKELAKKVAESMREKEKTRTLLERPLTALDKLTKSLPKRKQSESAVSPTKKLRGTGSPVEEHLTPSEVVETERTVATDEISLSSLPEDSETDVAESPSITISEVSWSKSSSVFLYIATRAHHSIISDRLESVGVNEEATQTTPHQWYFYPTLTSNVSQPCTTADFQSIFSDPRVYYYPDDTRSSPPRSRTGGFNLRKTIYKAERQALIGPGLEEHKVTQGQPMEHEPAEAEEEVQEKEIVPVISSRNIEWDMMRRAIKIMKDEQENEEVMIICKEVKNDQDIVISREVMEASPSDYDLIRFDPQPGHPPPEPIIDKERKNLAKIVLKQIRALVRRFKGINKNQPDLEEKAPKMEEDDKKKKERKRKKKEKKEEKEKGIARFKKWISGRRKEPECKPIEIGNPPIRLELRPKPPPPPRTNIQIVWLPKRLIEDFGDKLTYEQFLKLKLYKDQEERHNINHEKMDVDSPVAEPQLAVDLYWSSSSTSSLESGEEIAAQALIRMSKLLTGPYAQRETTKPVEQPPYEASDSSGRRTIPDNKLPPPQIATQIVITKPQEQPPYEASDSSGRRTIPDYKLPPTQIAAMEIEPNTGDYVSSDDEIPLPSPPIQIDDYEEEDELEPSIPLTPPEAFEIMTSPTPIPETPSPFLGVSSSSEYPKQAESTLPPPAAGLQIKSRSPQETKMDTEPQPSTSAFMIVDDEAKWKRQGAKPKGWKAPVNPAVATLTTTTTEVKGVPVPPTAASGVEATLASSTSSEVARAEPVPSTSAEGAAAEPAVEDEPRTRGPRLKKRYPGDEELQIRHTVPARPPNPDLLLMELRNRRVIYRHKLTFAVLMSHLPADVQITDASIDWLATLKGMLRIAHTMRMHGVELLFTNCFSIEWVDFFVNTYKLRNRMPFQEVMSYWTYIILDGENWDDIFQVGLGVLKMDE